jgi:hypothetical protein
MGKQPALPNTMVDHKAESKRGNKSSYVVIVRGLNMWHHRREHGEANTYT